MELLWFSMKTISILFIICHVLQSMEGGLEQERLQQQAELNQRVNDEEVTTGLKHTQQHANRGT